MNNQRIFTEKLEKSTKLKYKFAEKNSNVYKKYKLLEKSHKNDEKKSFFVVFFVHKNICKISCSVK